MKVEIVEGIVLKLLILGGTVYLGRHAVSAALERGHEVTLFHRGRSNPDLFPEAERLIGDRAADLGRLAGRRWDAVIDTSGYLPSVVRASGAALAGTVGHYLFVSTISVYADTEAAAIDESSPVSTLGPGQAEVLTGETYGALKAGCERALAEVVPATLQVVRAGLILGPHDTTDRSAYWPRRFARGGEVLAPGSGDRPVQFVDVRDLAEWMVRSCESRTTGTFNATGPERTLTMREFLEACRSAAGTQAETTWVDEAFLLERGIKPYSELPLWVPEQHRAYGSVNVARAIAAGLRFRPAAETARDALAWERTLPPGPRPPRAGISIPPGLAPGREAELLEEWKARAAAR